MRVNVFNCTLIVYQIKYRPCVDTTTKIKVTPF